VLSDKTTVKFDGFVQSMHSDALYKDVEFRVYADGPNKGECIHVWHSDDVGVYVFHIWLVSHTYVSIAIVLPVLSSVIVVPA